MFIGLISVRTFARQYVLLWIWVIWQYIYLSSFQTHPDSSDSSPVHGRSGEEEAISVGGPGRGRQAWRERGQKKLERSRPVTASSPPPDERSVFTWQSRGRPVPGTWRRWADGGGQDTRVQKAPEQSMLGGLLALSWQIPTLPHPLPPLCWKRLNLYDPDTTPPPSPSGQNLFRISKGRKEQEMEVGK